MKFNDLINELLDLLDENPDVQKIKTLKKELLNDKEFQGDLERYHSEGSVLLKRKLFANPSYFEYLKCESNLNLLIYEIKKQFNTFSKRICQNANH